MRCRPPAFLLLALGCLEALGPFGTPGGALDSGVSGELGGATAEEVPAARPGPARGPGARQKHCTSPALSPRAEAWASDQGLAAGPGPGAISVRPFFAPFPEAQLPLRGFDSLGRGAAWPGAFCPCRLLCDSGPSIACLVEIARVFNRPLHVTAALSALVDKRACALPWLQVLLSLERVYNIYQCL